MTILSQFSPEGAPEIRPVASPLRRARPPVRKPKPIRAPAGAREETMPSTHLSLHYHLVFSTKNRRPTIDGKWRNRLHAYLGGALRTAGGVAEAVGGTADHVHLLAGLRATHCLSDVMRDVKQTSSEWVHETIQSAIFSWQEGYGAFTVSASNIDRVRKYILNQEAHHKKKSFQEEYVNLPEKSGVEYDAKYLW